MIRVMIVDDHGVVREGLRRILNEVEDVEVLRTASSGEEAIQALRGAACDVVLMDISMPGRGGMEALKEIKRLRPATAVLVLSMYPEDQYAMRALRAGASGYVMKERTPDELVTAIRKVAAGGTYVSGSLAESLAEHVAGGTPEVPHERLSDREDQVLRMLAGGQSLKDIAQQLGVCAKTVSTYKRRMLKKMRAKNVAQLIRYSIDHGLM